MKINFRYEGEKNSKKKQNIQETIEFILNKNYGETILNRELSDILGYNIDYDEEFKKYKSTMLRVKNFLIKYGYILKSVGGAGYYILKPSQISSHCYRTYVKKAIRTIDKSNYVLECTKQAGMNKDRKEEIENMIQMSKDLSETMWNTVTESAYYSRKEYYDNLEK